MATLHINNESHYDDFISLNEQWISHFFNIEEADIFLAANPGSIVQNGGFIFSLTESDQVIGVCALFNLGDGVYELARLAVEENSRGKGYGDRLVKEAINTLISSDAKKVRLLSNTVLKPAMTLYMKHGFYIVSEGVHPTYSRCNIVMEREV